MSSDIPAGAVPENIGKVVSVQVFSKDKHGDLLPDTLCKYVGVLGTYCHDKEHFVFTLEGNQNGLISVSNTTQYAEIYPIELLSGPLEYDQNILDQLYDFVNKIQITASTMGPQNIRHRMKEIVDIVRSK